MYLNLKTEKINRIKNKKRTPLWVITCHLIVLGLLFVTFTFKSCTDTQPESIKVSLSSLPMKQNQLSESKAEQPDNSVNKKFNEPIKPKAEPKKQWKPLDPSQIKKSTKIIKKKRQPEKIYKNTSSSDIASRIKSSLSNMKFSSSNTVPNSVLSYYDKVSSVLYSNWRQPGRAIMSGSRPTVGVNITVDSDGRISDFKIIRKSGIYAMDSSVENLFKKLKFLPAPPQGKIQFDVTMELSE